MHRPMHVRAFKLPSHFGKNSILCSRDLSNALTLCVSFVPFSFAIARFFVRTKTMSRIITIRSPSRKSAGLASIVSSLPAAFNHVVWQILNSSHQRLRAHSERIQILPWRHRRTYTLASPTTKRTSKRPGRSTTQSHTIRRRIHTHATHHQHPPRPRRIPPPPLAPQTAPLPNQRPLASR